MQSPVPVRPATAERDRGGARMARIRSAKPELLDDEKAAQLPDDAWRLWVSSWLLADDYGNFRADPAFVQGRVFWGRPGPPSDTAALLRRLGVDEFLQFYSVRGQRYAHIRTWVVHQKVDHPGKPLCPGPELADQDGGGDSGGGGGTPGDQRSTDSESPRETLARTSRLTGTGTGTGTPIRTRTETKGPRPPSLFEQLLEQFGTAWSAKYSEPYTPTPGDRSQLGRLLRSLKTPDEASALPALFAAYLRDGDPFVADKQRHSLAFFCTSGGLNKYRTKPPAPTSRPRANGAREREERSNEATERWLARKGGAHAR